MRLPNGFGSVYKLAGNRRRPWTARITTHKEIAADGKELWKYKYIGYYESREEALTALIHYNENPHSLNMKQITFAEMFERWSAEFYPTTTQSSIQCHNAAYKLCGDLKDMAFCEIRKMHMQRIVDTCGKNYPTLAKLKILFGHLYRFALENDLATKDYSNFVSIAPYKDKNPNRIERTPFTDEELALLWRHQREESIGIILLMIYSGMRLGELRALKKENINLDKRCFQIIQSKTTAGVRTSPIAKKILPVFEYWMNKNNSEYFIAINNQYISDKKFRSFFWNKAVNELGLSHLPHDTRHTCVTLLTKAEVDERIIKKIVGHAGSGVTEQIYTHFDLDILLDAIDKI